MSSSVKGVAPLDAFNVWLGPCVFHSGEVDLFALALKDLLVFLLEFVIIIGLILLFHLSKEHNDNLFLVIMLIFLFPAFYISQKYYEPMFFIMFFLMFKSEIPKLFLKTKKNIYYLALYLGTYLTSAIINDILKITKTLTFG